MGLFSKFERRVEDGFEGINDKLFDAPISPVQITKKAEKQMRREKDRWRWQRVCSYALYRARESR